MLDTPQKIKRCTNCELSYGGTPSGRCPLILQEPNLSLDQKLMMVYFTSIIGCDSCIIKEWKPAYLVTDKAITEAMDLIRRGDAPGGIAKLKEYEYEDGRRQGE